MKLLLIALCAVAVFARPQGQVPAPEDQVAVVPAVAVPDTAAVDVVNLPETPVQVIESIERICIKCKS